MSYFKIFNKDEIENNYQYRDGLNILCDEFEKYDFEYCNDLNLVKFVKLSDKIIYRNFYFTDVEHIFNFLSCDNDSHIREILLPDDYPEFKINKNLLNDNWKIKQIILGKRYELSNINTFKFLIEVGANVNASNDCALKWACYRGYFDIVKYLISEGANINSIDNSALFIASLGNQTNIVKYLIENGADVHVDDNALLIACEKGNLDIVKILVESGALSPSELAADKSNTSTDMYELNDCALSTSSRLGHLNIVKYLIESSTDVRFDSAIKRAFQGNQFDIVKYLVNYGADIHFDNDFGLLCACANGNLNMVKLFIESGIDTYACGNALQLASSKSYIDIVKLLVESGVDIHFNNDSALRYTTNVDIMKFLIESGADIYSNNNDYYIITIAITKNNLNVIKFLVEIGIDINVDNYALITAISMANTDIINYLIEADTNISDEQRLQIACGFGHLDTVISLVEQGVNIYANYIYLLRVASQNGHLNVINFLIENCANNQPNYNYLLIHALEKGHLDIVKFLIENGADIHTSNDQALILACRSGQLEVVKFLLGNGANIHVDSNRALEAAVLFGHSSIVRLLIENGANIANAILVRSCVLELIKRDPDIIFFLLEKGFDICANYNHTQRWCYNHGYDVIMYDRISGRYRTY